MGNSSSHTHEPLERGFTRGTFGDVKNMKAASFRFSKRSPKRMDRLRRSFRDSFRRRKDRVPESSKPHQWQSDAEAVRSATCSFPVKYLGCVEVFESRGMHICEEALKVLRNSRRRPIRGLLHVSGDGLRVVDDDTKGLIVDQTIEKVSFCAPDRNHERGFSYICRDGTTRRWMCHGFLASKDSGERLSHAVGCAFTVCLERKQRRDTECAVTMTFDSKTSTFTRNGSFRQTTMTERLHNERSVDKKQVAVIPQQPKKQAHNPFAIERPHATPSMLERQGSFRGFTGLNSQSPFKRQMSLRLNDLPSNAERQKSFFEPLTNGSLRSVSPIPEVTSSSTVQPQPQIDNVSALCQELSQGLSLLTQNDANITTISGDELNFNLQTSTTTKSTTAAITSDYVLPSVISSDSLAKMINSTTITSSSGAIPTATIAPITSPNSDYLAMLPSSAIISQVSSTTNPLSMVVKPLPSAHISPIRHRASISGEIPSVTAQHMPNIATVTTTSPINAVSPTTAIVAPTTALPKPDQWLGEVVKSTSPMVKRAPALNLNARTKSLTTDPFDAEWVSTVTKTDDLKTADEHRSTNPFIQATKSAQTFQVQL